MFSNMKYEQQLKKSLNEKLTHGNPKHCVHPPSIEEVHNLLHSCNVVSVNSKQSWHFKLVFFSLQYLALMKWCILHHPLDH